MSALSGETFAVGDRGFSHYTMTWGTVSTEPDDQGWFYVAMDDGERTLLNNERFMRPGVAVRYGYGDDPKAEA